MDGKVRSNGEVLGLMEHLYGDYKMDGRITLEGLQEIQDLLQKHLGMSLDEFLYDFSSKFFDGFSTSTGSTKSVESSSSSSSKKRKRSDSDHDGSMIFNKKMESFPLLTQTPRNKEDQDHELDLDLMMKAIGFCEQVLNKVSYEDYWVLLNCLQDYASGKISKGRLKVMIVDYFPDFMDGFLEVLESFTEPSSSSKTGEGDDQIGNIQVEIKKPNKSRSTMKMTQLDDDELTPSYHKILPKDISRFRSSGIDELGKEVLNFSCFSKGIYLGNNDKVVRRPENPTDKREDEMFEKDMLATWTYSTEKNARKLRKAIDQKGQIQRMSADSKINANKYLTSYNFRLIERMYNNRGLQMVDQLCLSPETALPVLIERLKKILPPKTRKLEKMKCYPRPLVTQV